MAETFIANPTLEDIPFDVLKDTYALWLGLKEEHGQAKRKHFSPILFKEHLPYMVLIDYEPEGKRFKARLIGTHYTEAIGFEATGMYVDELPYAEEMQSRFEWLVDNEQPYYAHLDKMKWAGQEFRHYAVLGCPLYGEDGKINMILFRVTFERLDGIKAISPLR